MESFLNTIIIIIINMNIYFYVTIFTMWPNSEIWFWEKEETFFCWQFLFLPFLVSTLTFNIHFISFQMGNSAQSKDLKIESKKSFLFLKKIESMIIFPAKITKISFPK